MYSFVVILPLIYSAIAVGSGGCGTFILRDKEVERRLQIVERCWRAEGSVEERGGSSKLPSGSPTMHLYLSISLLEY